MVRLLAEDVVEGARALLGWTLATEECSARIVETEAYGPEDPGCHAFRGETPRNRAMFGPPGRAYLYFTYGNHWMLNVTALEPGLGAAVLIRAAEPLGGLAMMRSRRAKAVRDRDLLSGPGKVAQAFGLDGSWYGLDLFDAASPLRLLPPASPVAEVRVGTRIGLSPGKGDETLWRFADAERLPWVSRPLGSLRGRDLSSP
jgi:DNA-3-methyladenine glycosylase